MINRDFCDLFAALVAHEVRFLIVGGYAVAFHGHPRFTKDVDILVASDLTNAERVYAALAAFGAPMDDLRVEDFTDPENVFQIGLPPNRVDVLTAIAGVGFEEAWRTRAPSRYGDVEVAFIGLEALLKAKRGAGRPQDLVDADELERRRAPPSG
jgi:hypothetical protein